jgi:hypothetical protein
MAGRIVAMARRVGDREGWARFLGMYACFFAWSAASSRRVGRWFGRQRDGVRSVSPFWTYRVMGDHENSLIPCSGVTATTVALRTDSSVEESAASGMAGRAGARRSSLCSQVLFGRTSVPCRDSPQG